MLLNMVNNTKTSGVSTQCKDENGGDHKDCHNIVKSSESSCCEHHLRQFRRVNVACQTDNAGLFTDLGEANCSKTVASPQKNDGSKPEGTLRLMIKNFHNMTDTVRGPGVPINNVPWKIMVMPRQHVMQKKGTQKCLGFFLQCCPDAYSDSWSCQASAELRLISQKSGVPNFTRKTNHTYTAKENDWGYSCFMTWADILDEAQGYIKDDKVILEVFVKADPPKNVLTYDGFCKKIQDYMRLADLQSSRGLIDKAIEVNQSALKFCKDKDAQCKDELEVQKQKLIEQKLKQSIERIEKGKTVIGENDEDATANLNALRQALTGNLATNAANQAKTAEKDKDKKDEKTTEKSPAVTEKKLSNSNKNATDAVTKQPVKEGTPKKDRRGIVNDENDENKACKRTEGDGQSAECSSASEAEDDDDELCDSCIQEQLETIISKETSEMACQTEPVAVKASAVKSNSANAITKTASQVTALSQKAAWDLAKKNQQSLSSAGSMDEIESALGTKVPRWSAEKEAELLDLITQESRQSLDSIRDTLERLVHLAQDGEVHPGLDFDLTALREANHRVVKDGALVGHQLPPVGLMDSNATMDIIELPGDLTPPDTDVVDLAIRAADTTTTTNANNNNNISKDGGSSNNDGGSTNANSATATVDAGDVTPPISKTTSNTSTDNDTAGWACNTKSADQPPAPPSSPRTPLLNAQNLEHDYSEEEYTLIKHAKQIVESKAEELVSKYSQLIEQSEATRLAETVKKVEKRMKDIEKQTMTCRKELADECDRHYKEEQKLIKANKQLRAQVDQANERSERLNAQVKERKAEIKKLEKRLKAETQTSADNYDLQQRIEQLEKELANALKKNVEESKRHQRETQSLIDTKKQLQQDLSSASSDIERLNNQLEEKTNAMRKMENRHEQERKQTNASLREAIERAKKAEVNLLEFKLEIGLKVLQRAADDCSANIKHWEGEHKRYSTAQRFDEAKLVQSTLTEWTDTKTKISAMLSTAKNDFVHQMDSVRNGKQLAALPTLEVPKPPPPPKPSQQLISMLNREQQAQQAAASTSATETNRYQSGATSSSSQGQSVTPPSQTPTASSNTASGTQETPNKPPLAPIGARPATAMSNGPTGGPSSQQSPLVADSASNSSMQQSPHVQMSAIQLPASANSQSSMPAGPPAMSNSSTAVYHQSSQNAGLVASNAASSHTSGVPSPSVATLAALQQHARHMHQPPPSSAGGMSNGFSLWDSQAVADQLFSGQANRSGGVPVSGSLSQFGAAPPTSATAPHLQNGHAGMSGMASIYDQWGAGSNAGGGTVQSNGIATAAKHGMMPPPPHGAQPPPQQNGPHSSTGNQQQQQQQQGAGGPTQQWAIGWGCYPPAPSNSTGGMNAPSSYVIDSRNSSPIGAHNERARNLEMVLETLRNLYPTINIDMLREMLNVYRSSLPQRSFKNMTAADVVNGVMQFIEKRITSNWQQQQQQQQLAATPSSTSEMNVPPPATPTSGGSSQQQQPNDVCYCGIKLPQHDTKAVTTLKCRHRFHTQCAHNILSAKQHCPTCGAFSPCPDEYPELA